MHFKSMFLAATCLAQVFFLQSANSSKALDEDNIDNVKILITNPRDHGGGSIIRLGRGQYLLHDIGNSPGNALDVTRFVGEVRRDVARHNYVPRLTFVSSHPQEDAFNLIRPTIENLRQTMALNADFILGGNELNYRRTRNGIELINYLQNNLRILPYYSNTTNNVNFASRVLTTNNIVSFLNPCAGGTYDGPGRHYSHPVKVDHGDLNKISLLTRIQSGNISAILPGGAKSFEVVAATADSYNFDLTSNIAVTSHHGGNGAIDEDYRYYDRVRPEYVVSSVSPILKYNHPYSESVLNAYRSPRLANFPIGNGYNGHNMRYYTKSTNSWTTPGMTTTRGIFSTLTQGDVSFSWGNLDLNPRIVVAAY